MLLFSVPFVHPRWRKDGARLEPGMDIAATAPAALVRSSDRRQITHGKVNEHADASGQDALSGIDNVNRQVPRLNVAGGYDMSTIGMLPGLHPWRSQSDNGCLQMYESPILEIGAWRDGRDAR